MTSDMYYLDKAIPRGSAFYYSASHLAGEQRKAVFCIQAFYQLLIDIVNENQEASVAQIKFQWWRNEIANLQQNPSHPLTVLLNQTLENYRIPREDLLALIAGVEEKIYMQPFMNFEELTIHIMRTAGLKEKIIMQIIGADISLEIIYQLSLIEELFYFIQHLRKDVAKGLILFPVDELDKFAVTVSTLEQFKTTPEIKKFLAFQHERMNTLFVDVRNKINEPDKKALRSLLVRVKIALATFEEIKKEDFKVLEQFTKLTPLRMWWIGLNT